MTVKSDETILALDVGAARIGVAVARQDVRLAQPVGAWDNDDTFVEKLRSFCQSEQVGRVVVGLPRGLDGQETAQTASVRQFVARLASTLDLPLSWQDEAVTSAQAEVELQERNKPYSKGDIDALAATYILEDYLRDNERMAV